MVQVSLVDYIKKQLEQGLNLDQVKAQLKEQGYDPSEVDSSAQYAFNLENNPQLAQNQRIEQLSVYVEQQLKAGYQVPQIKQYLINSGYPYYEVDSAINLIQKPKREEHHVLIAAIVIIVLMGGAILTITMFNVKLFAEHQNLAGKELLDIKVKKLTTAPVSGESLDFQLDVFNLGAERRYDIILDYKILNRNTKEEIAGQKETFAIETSTSRVFSIEIPPNAPTGKYVLEVDAAYDEVSAKAGFIFDIYNAEAVKEITPEIETNVTGPVPSKILEKLQEANVTIPGITHAPEPEIVGPATTPAPTEPLPKADTEPFAGKTKAEKIELIKRTSVIDPARAVAECKTFKYKSQQRDCITEVAKFKEDMNLCQYIEESNGRDSCYMQMFIENPEQADCSKVGETLQASCNMMKQGAAMQAQFS
ncbi:MAG: hypothetical protein ACE5DM_02860 [Candidatus Nanoarchaeia archaeon]